jgi:hypothetical protein
MEKKRVPERAEAVTLSCRTPHFAGLAVPGTATAG